MRLVGYVRVSRVGGRDSDIATSAPVQRERIAAQARASGHTLIEVVEDLDQPGSRYEREGLQAALAAVEEGRADGLLVYSLDRFARSVPDAAVALRRLEQAGGVLVSIRDALDTSTPVGRFARTMMLALAELELERIREGWATSRSRAVGRGVHVAKVPRGYLRGHDRRLVPDPEWAPLIADLFSRRAKGEPWASLCDWLDEAKPMPSKWTVGGLTTIVRNRVYRGEARSGDTVNTDAHDPLVDEQTWLTAQQARGRVPRGKQLLTGLLHCASCGERMHSARTGSGHLQYRCYGRTGRGVCTRRARISAAKAEPFIVGRVLEEIVGAAVHREPVEDAQVEQALAAAQQAERELVAYRDANLVSVIGADSYTEGLRERQHLLDAARSAYERARFGKGAVAARLDVAADLWPTWTLPERREFLHALVARVDCAPAGAERHLSLASDRLRIAWKG